MTVTESQDSLRELDPFGFWANYASAIQPLGGEERNPDPRYVFHTPYVDFRPGRVILTIRFQGLKASFGELRVNINAFVPGSGRDAMFVTSSRLYLADSAALERGLTMSIMSVAGATYAAFGFCVDGTDGRATGLTITVEEIGTPDGVIAEAMLLPTQFGTSALQMPARLVGNHPPMFCDPVSQPMTEDQLAEPAFQAWSAKLPDADIRKQWQLAFIAQVLDRYGMLRPGARGIALGPDSAALAPIITARGCEGMLAAISSLPGQAGIAWSMVACAPLDASADAIGSPLAIAEQPADQRGFDFLWSIGLAGQGYAAGSSVNMLTEAMAVLRPGGYAVHMFDLATSADAGPQALPRSEVNRLAVTLISRGHTVAQLTFANNIRLAQPSVPFGLIVRKG